MDMTNIISAVLVLFIMGVVFALLLGIAAKVFAVEVDERVPLVRDCLPGRTAAAVDIRAVTVLRLQLLRAMPRSMAVRLAALLRQQRLPRSWVLRRTAQNQRLHMCTVMVAATR